jgi:FtsP/CotA-like multicopper oxidase with cupredoxin domain
MVAASFGGVAAALRKLVWLVLVCSCVVLAAAQDSISKNIVANQNRVAAGKLENAVLTVQLELRDGFWHPEADDGPELSVPALAEAGHPAQIPGPLLRMPEGTTVHVTVTNQLKKKATLYGLNTRPGDAKAGIELAPGESREVSFLAGAPGTYFYWARTSDVYKSGELTIVPPIFADSQMHGAFIVDPPGNVAPDRVFVLSQLIAQTDVLHPRVEVLAINGKSYPYTEPLEYTQGETIRWRIINPSFAEHPMHLHGAFYQIVSSGDFESDTTYEEGERQSVVTGNIAPAHTMMMEWKPPHAGRWLFHCHYHAHISTDERLPVITRVAPLMYGTPSAPTASSHAQHEAMGTMNDMAGLVLTINVKPSSATAPVSAPAAPPRKLDLVIEPTVAAGSTPTFSCSVREGKKIVTSPDRAMGPPIVVTRGEPVEITVLNHLTVPTTIHWHGIELDSYYDGVIGGGVGNQMSPAIAPGTNFIARFTPNRAGTFIYHTHAPDPNQLTGGVYGPLIVLEPGEQFNPERDKLLVVGTRDPGFGAMRITLNGSEDPRPLSFGRGLKYRLRVINIAPNLSADLLLGSAEHPITWRAVAKDGADLPPRLAKTTGARLHFASGEVYDFELQPETPGEIPLQIENLVSGAKLMGKIVVQ